MKNNAGLSMIEIIIAIIVLLIIVFIATYNSKDAIPQAKATELRAEMIAVEQAIEVVKAKLLTNDDFQLIEGEHYDDTAEGNYYIIYGNLDEEHTVAAAKKLGINDLKRNYLVNYTTGAFELENPVAINNTEVRTLEGLENIIDGGSI